MAKYCETICTMVAHDLMQHESYRESVLACPGQIAQECLDLETGDPLGGRLVHCPRLQGTEAPVFPEEWRPDEPHELRTVPQEELLDEAIQIRDMYLGGNVVDLALRRSNTDESE